MAIIQNHATAIGDVLVIRTDTPAVGVIALLGFIDDIDNETGSRFFIKQFRYSIDGGCTFSDFIDLTIANVQAVDITQGDWLIIEFYYKRSGTDDTGDLILNSVDVQSSVVEIDCGTEYEKMLFGNYINCSDACCLNWAINVLEKLYKQGIVPNYIERARSESNLEDRDYIDLWRAITKYFSYFICLARNFSRFYENKELLQEFVKQRDMLFCNEEVLYIDLYFLMKNYYDEIRQRGTIQIVRKKNSVILDLGSESSISNSQSASQSASASASLSLSQSLSDITLFTKQIDGELLRLICYCCCDEFIMNLRESKKIGFNIGNSSPLFRGTWNMMGCNKAYEDTKDIEDITKYPLINAADSSIITDGNKKVLHFDANDPDLAGIGIDVDNLTALQIKSLVNRYGIAVDSGLSYEITFYLKQFDKNILNALFIGFQIFDSETNLRDAVHVETEVDLNFFCNTNLAVGGGVDGWSFFRFIIYDRRLFNTWDIDNTYVINTIVKISAGLYYKSKKNVPTGISFLDTTYWQFVPYNDLELSAFKVYKSFNIVGAPWITSDDALRNLRFKDEKVCKFVPYIAYPKEFAIWDLKIKPVSTPYSLGFIQTNNWIDFWLKKKNKTYTVNEFEDILRRKLLTYDSTFKVNYLEEFEV